MNKKALSFVEILVSVAIIALLATIGLSYKNSYNENKFNTKVEADLATLNNSFLAYKQENSSLPTAKSNDNYFKIDSSYAHNENDNAFGVHGFVTDGLIPKKYLNYLPLDPRTNQFYAYGKTLNPDKLQFEFAGVVTKDGESESIISGDYDGKALVGLIREYNGPQFIYNKSTQNFPFNPTERLMTAKIGSYSGSVLLEIDGNTYTNDILNKTLTAGDKITVNGDGFANIYYSDGSRSTLESDSELVLTDMKYKSDNNLLTKISLNLKNGSIWTKATKLNPDGSEFEITTQDATAAVRGTIFKTETNGTSTKVIVDKGEVEVANETNSRTVDSGKKIEASTSSLDTITNANTSELLEGNDKEIVLPSNIKPEITKIENNEITISQAKEGYYVKYPSESGNIMKGECNSNGECEISGTTNEIQLCTEIGTQQENCSETIKMNNQVAYEDDKKSEEEKDIDKINKAEDNANNDAASNADADEDEDENNANNDEDNNCIIGKNDGKDVYGELEEDGITCKVKFTIDTSLISDNNSAYYYIKNPLKIYLVKLSTFYYVYIKKDGSYVPNPPNINNGDKIEITKNGDTYCVNSTYCTD